MLRNPAIQQAILWLISIAVVVVSAFAVGIIKVKMSMRVELDDEEPRPKQPGERSFYIPLPKFLKNLIRRWLNRSRSQP